MAVSFRPNFKVSLWFWFALVGLAVALWCNVMVVSGSLQISPGLTQQTDEGLPLTVTVPLTLLVFFVQTYIWSLDKVEGSKKAKMIIGIGIATIVLETMVYTIFLIVGTVPPSLIISRVAQIWTTATSPGGAFTVFWWFLDLAVGLAIAMTPELFANILRKQISMSPSASRKAFQAYVFLATSTALWANFVLLNGSITIGPGVTQGTNEGLPPSMALPITVLMFLLQTWAWRQVDLKDGITNYKELGFVVVGVLSMWMEIMVYWIFLLVGTVPPAEMASRILNIGTTVALPGGLVVVIWLLMQFCVSILVAGCPEFFATLLLEEEDVPAPVTRSRTEPLTSASRGGTVTTAAAPQTPAPASRFAERPREGAESEEDRVRRPAFSRDLSRDGVQ